jgi:hypothetical protein
MAREFTRGVGRGERRSRGACHILHHFGRAAAGGGGRGAEGTAANGGNPRRAFAKGSHQRRNVSRETQICAALWTIWCTINCTIARTRRWSSPAPDSTIAGPRALPHRSSPREGRQSALSLTGLAAPAADRHRLMPAEGRGGPSCLCQARSRYARCHRNLWRTHEPGRGRGRFRDPLLSW